MVVETRRRGGPVLLLGVLLLIVDGYDLFVLGTVGPALLRYTPWGVTPPVLGLLGGVTAFGAAVGAVVAGWAGDVLGRRLPLAVSLVWVAGWMALSAVVPTVELFAMTRFFTGTGLGALIPLVVAVVTEAAPVARRSLFVGAAMTGVAVGGLVAAFAGRVLLGPVPFRTLFLIGALALVLLPAVWWLVPAGIPAAQPSDAPGRAGTLLTAGHRRATLLFWASTFLGLVVVYGASTWLPALMVSAGYDQGSALEFLIAFNLGAIVGTLAVTALADRLRIKAVTLACALVASGAMLVLSTPQARWLLLVMAAAAGLGALGTQNLVNAYVSRYHEPPVRGTALGLCLGVGRLGAIAGPVYLSLVTVLSASPKAGFYAFVVPALMEAALIAAIPRRRASMAPAATGVAA